MPVVFQDRSPISLYDAQHSSSAMAPVPSTIIEQILATLLRFKRTCQQLGVHDGNIRVVATEATRNAKNRDALLDQIRRETGWVVQLLAKEEEGRLGAMGIASSVTHLDGVCMDMGGGSLQLTWLSTKTSGDIVMGPSVSLPYGAAALMFRLSKVTAFEKEQFHNELASKIHDVVEKDLQIPVSSWDAATKMGGFNLYLSGGGFRAWGHILMSQEIMQPYPIPIINGYSVLGSQVDPVIDMNTASPRIFRISSRRASQIPAVQALIKAIKQARLPIAKVVFAQGGVREGLLYSDLPLAVRAQNPLVTSTVSYAPQSAAALGQLLRDAVPCPLEPELLEAVVNLLYAHGSLPKDIRAAAALRCTTTGYLAGAHGLSHRDRCLVALILCERWGGDISDIDASFMDSLKAMCGQLSWWTRYIGCVAKGIANLFPAGLVPNDEQTVSVKAGSPSGENISAIECCWIKMTVFKSDVAHIVRAWAKDLKKLGKEKNWAPGERGLKVDVQVTLDTGAVEIGDTSRSF